MQNLVVLCTYRHQGIGREVPSVHLPRAQDNRRNILHLGRRLVLLERPLVKPIVADHLGRYRTGRHHRVVAGTQTSELVARSRAPALDWAEAIVRNPLVKPPVLRVVVHVVLPTATIARLSAL